MACSFFLLPSCVSLLLSDLSGWSSTFLHGFREMNQPGICYTSNYMTFAAAGNGGIVVPAVLFCEICGPVEHLLRKTRRPPVSSLVGGLCIGGKPSKGTTWDHLRVIISKTVVFQPSLLPLSPTTLNCWNLPRDIISAEYYIGRQSCRHNPEGLDTVNLRD